VSKIIDALATFKFKVWTHLGFYTIDVTNIHIFDVLHRALTQIYTEAFKSRRLSADSSISGYIRDLLIDACFQTLPCESEALYETRHRCLFTICFGTVDHCSQSQTYLLSAWTHNGQSEVFKNPLNSAPNARLRCYRHIFNILKYATYFGTYDNTIPRIIIRKLVNTEIFPGLNNRGWYFFFNVPLCLYKVDKQLT